MYMCVHTHIYQSTSTWNLCRNQNPRRLPPRFDCSPRVGAVLRFVLQQVDLFANDVFQAFPIASCQHATVLIFAAPFPIFGLRNIHAYAALCGGRDEYHSGRTTNPTTSRVLCWYFAIKGTHGSNIIRIFLPFTLQHAATPLRGAVQCTIHQQYIFNYTCNLYTSTL
jgi:hypothetical protein